jgi:cytochrome c-type biogenesis protein CcmH
MIAFAALATLLALFLVGWLLWPARRRGQVSAREVNISIYRDQLRELEADLAAAKISQDDYGRSRRELERRLLDDVAVPESPGRRAILWPAIAIVPVLAIAVYFVVGSPRMIQQEGEHAVTAQQVEAMVARLAAKLRENPDDVDGWKLLGRSYGALQRFDLSADAYARAATLAPRDPQLLADFADALAMARGQTLQGEPEKLVQRALEIDPKNLKALALLGTAAFERKDFQRAADAWKRMLDVVPPGSEDARAIQANIEEALALKGSRVLRGEVRLSEKLKAQASPDDLVYIFARAVEGPPMPLAVARKRVRDLPTSFALDDTMAMAPAAKLSNYPRVVVSARISKSGTANPQPGDLQGASAPVANDASGVRVVIDSVVR